MPKRHTRSVAAEERRAAKRCAYENQKLITTLTPVVVKDEPEQPEQREQPARPAEPARQRYTVTPRWILQLEQSDARARAAQQYARQLTRSKACAVGGTAGTPLLSFRH